MIPWNVLRGAFLRRLEALGAKPLFATLSGAHLYGFPSADSDFDVRGSYVLPLREAVSMAPRRETIESSGPDAGRLVDLVAHEAEKFFRLMLKKNGYVMEQVFSPLEIVGGPLLEELRGIARRCITRHIYHHYRGFADNHLRQFAKESPKRVKTVLYLYRILMTGLHVLRTGEIQTHLPTLAAGNAAVLELIERKQREHSELPDPRPHEPGIERLRSELDDAYARSTLPDAPAAAGELNEFLVRLRLG